jgi:hypothetical protein
MAGLELLFDSLEDRTFESTPMPIGRRTPAMPGSVIAGPDTPSAQAVDDRRRPAR